MKFKTGIQILTGQKYNLTDDFCLGENTQELTTWSFLHCLWECWDSQETSEREGWQSLVWQKSLDCTCIGSTVQELSVGFVQNNPSQDQTTLSQS